MRGLISDPLTSDLPHLIGSKRAEIVPPYPRSRALGHGIRVIYIRFTFEFCLLVRRFPFLFFFLGME